MLESYLIPGSQGIMDRTIICHFPAKRAMLAEGLKRGSIKKEAWPSYSKEVAGKLDW
jgi:hypothetical protein